VTEHEFSHLSERAELMGCCREVKNLLVEEITVTGDSVKASCQVCGRSHYKINARPFDIGFRLRKL
jgi:hypothetical protein